MENKLMPEDRAAYEAPRLVVMDEIEKVTRSGAVILPIEIQGVQGPS